MSDEKLFKAKIAALFHDPPHKPWTLEGHEQRGREFVEQLVGPVADSLWQCVKKADRLASGTDRHAWLGAFGVNPESELEIVHPLAGESILVPGTVTGTAFQLAVTEEQVQQLNGLFDQLRAEVAPLSSNLRLLFLALWRFTPDLLRAIELKQKDKEARRFRLGTLWEILPADSRMPDHPVMVHTSLVAALASLLLREQGAALLRVAIGPVQDFISASRKLSDLWSSSSLLAELTWQAMLPVVEELGPEHVIYPSLYFEPRFDRWLLQQLGLPKAGSSFASPGAAHSAVAKRLEEIGVSDASKNPLVEVLATALRHLPRALLVPTLPNLFTAIVPLQQAEALARRCAESVRAWWKDLAGKAGAAAGSGSEYEERARRQAEAMLEVFWSVAPWDLQADPEAWSKSPAVWHRSEAHARRGLRIANAFRAAERGYEPNAGVLYADVFEQGEMLVLAAKQERYAGRTLPLEGGLKCAVCGEREVLGPGDFWIQRTEGYSRRKDQNVLKDGEQLCGVCTAKRHFELEEIEASALGRQPSTGEIASSSFKLAVIRACLGVAPGAVSEKVLKELREAVRDFVQAAERAQQGEAIEKGDLSVYCAPLIDVTARSGEEWLRKFAKIDGQWLLPFPREEVSEKVPEELLAAAGRLRRAAKEAGIAPPRPYLAVLSFDGDELGKWLNGTHPRFPHFGASLHSKVRRAFENGHPNLKEISKTPRPVTPAYHAALSATAAAFARITAPLTIEAEGIPGHLVYAGGDDALFLCPIPEAVELARCLRLRFSGHPGSFTEKEGASYAPWVAASLGKQGMVWPANDPSEVERLGLAFGWNATASVGLCVFHYRWPLGSALRAAREALKEAKNNGRNRLGIVIQRRSGSMTKCFVPFPGSRPDRSESAQATEKGAKALDAFQNLIHAFQNGQVSTRLASLFRAELAPLLGPHPWHRPSVRGPAEAASLWEVACTLARRVAHRREVQEEGGRQGFGPSPSALLVELGEAVKPDLENLGASEQLARVEAAILQWSELVTAAAFLAREGGE